ncbi:MAG: 1-acyl-sn-glycerol-3-phosphate acyltransferase [Bacteroidetes bacterium]|nr:1-acyl-sn-glycerol-3-phosphate acyltransferase [Bacteroidota bacterium]MBS1648077.1 1-acyl-sn-glycerol-3-phosphate acyltransferase [Bacteroidota bacterium]
MKAIQIIYSVYAFCVFVIIMLLALPVIVVASAFAIKGGNFIYNVCKIWAKLWYIFIFVKHKEVYEVKHNKKQQYIFVANHISYMDIPVMVLSIHQPFRALGKYEMIKVPIFGWIYKAAVILVDRKNAETRARSVRALKAAIAKNISIFIFPEGTFNETENILKPFYDGAFRVAIETQTPIKPLLFPDTIKRLHYKSIFSLLPGTCRVIYLDEVSVKGYTINNLPELKQKVFTIMEEGLKRYL